MQAPHNMAVCRYPIANETNLAAPRWAGARTLTEHLNDFIQQVQRHTDFLSPEAAAGLVCIPSLVPAFQNGFFRDQERAPIGLNDDILTDSPLWESGLRRQLWPSPPLRGTLSRVCDRYCEEVLDRAAPMPGRVC